MRNGRGAAMIGMAVGMAAGGLWLWRGHTGTQRTYSARGFGGYVGRMKPPDASRDPVAPIEAAYNAGRYSEAERLAAAVMAARENKPDPGSRREAARALWVAAYAAARRGDFGVARVRFSALRDRAAALPDHGSLLAPAGRAAAGDTAATAFRGEKLPTLEEEGAFQASICAFALGDKAGAERELNEFMTRYPRSILIHAAMKRIGRMHGGDVPREAEKRWQAAKALQARAEQAEMREASLCGPECLAELMRRQSQPGPTVHGLAAAMATGAEGTTLLSLAKVAERQGIALRGAELTTAGLAEQKLPAIALIHPGHYVLVESVTDGRIRVWDPDAAGPGHSGRREFTTANWEQVWTGLALVP